MSFEKELESLINRHCIENESDTPDFILAQYLRNCLDNFSETVNRREEWYGRAPEPVNTIEGTMTIEDPSGEKTVLTGVKLTNIQYSPVEDDK